MSDVSLVPLTIMITRDERERIEAAARDHGFANAEAYLHSLVQAQLKPDEVEPVDLRAEIKESLRQAMRGDVVSVESLWDDDDE